MIIFNRKFFYSIVAFFICSFISILIIIFSKPVFADINLTILYYPTIMVCFFNSLLMILMVISVHNYPIWITIDNNRMIIHSITDLRKPIVVSFNDIESIYYWKPGNVYYSHHNIILFIQNELTLIPFIPNKLFDIIQTHNVSFKKIPEIRVTRLGFNPYSGITWLKRGDLEGLIK